VDISIGDVLLLRRTTFTRTHSLITTPPSTTAFRFSLPKPLSYSSASLYCQKRIRQLRFTGKLFFILNFILHMLFLLHFPNSINLINYPINIRVNALFSCTLIRVYVNNLSHVRKLIRIACEMKINYSLFI